MRGGGGTRGKEVEAVGMRRTLRVEEGSHSQHCAALGPEQIYMRGVGHQGGALPLEKYFNAAETSWSNTAEMLSKIKHIFLSYYKANY